MILNYLFYRFSQLKIYRPTYWAKIFTPIVVAITLMPASLTLSRYFFGCYDTKANDLAIKLILSVIVLLIWFMTSRYYKPTKVKELWDKYSGESKLHGNVKLFLICVMLFGVFWYGSFVIRMLVKIPEC
jgi:hypothetical protein